MPATHDEEHRAWLDKVNAQRRARRAALKETKAGRKKLAATYKRDRAKYDGSRREYMREYMAKRRAAQSTASPSPSRSPSLPTSEAKQTKESTGQ